MIKVFHMLVVQLQIVGHGSKFKSQEAKIKWERRAGRPSGLPDASTPVGPERGGSTDLPPDDPRPHN